MRAADRITMAPGHVIDYIDIYIYRLYIYIYIHIYIYIYNIIKHHPRTWHVTMVAATSAGLRVKCLSSRLCSTASIVVEKTCFWNETPSDIHNILTLDWHHRVSNINCPTPCSQRIWPLVLACLLSCIQRLWRVQTHDISWYLVHVIHSGQPRLKYKVRRGPACVGRRSNARYTTEIIMFHCQETPIKSFKHSMSHDQRCNTSNFGKSQSPFLVLVSGQHTLGICKRTPGRPRVCVTWGTDARLLQLWFSSQKLQLNIATLR